MDTSSVHRYLRYPCDKHSCRSLVTLKFESQANREEVFWSPTQSGKVYIRPLLSCYQLPRCFRLMLVAAVTVSQTHKVKGQLFPFDRLTSDARRWVDTVLFSQFFTVSAKSRFYCPFPEFKWFFFSSFSFFARRRPVPFFFSSQKTIRPPSWRLFAEPNEVPTGSGRHLPVHIHEQPPSLSFPHRPNSSVCVSSHASRAVVFPVLCSARPEAIVQ